MRTTKNNPLAQANPFKKATRASKKSRKNKLRRMNPLTLVITCLLLSLGFSLALGACSSERKVSDKPVLTVTLEPLRYFTEAIAGAHFTVQSMVPQGSSPETYDPTPQQLVQLSQSVAYLRIGYIGFEQTWMDKLTASHPHLLVFDTSKDVAVMPDLTTHSHHSENLAHISTESPGEVHKTPETHAHVHAHAGGIEPHIWNSTRNAAVIARNVCEALCQLDTLHQADFRQRLDSLQQVIAQTDQAICRQLQQADRTFLIYHPALTYFARDYGLRQLSLEEGGKEPSPAHLKTLIETCRREQARVIFIQQEFDTRNAELIANELGVSVIPINPLSYDWPQEMLHIAQSLAH